MYPPLPWYWSVPRTTRPFILCGGRKREQPWSLDRTAVLVAHHEGYSVALTTTRSTNSRRLKKLLTIVLGIVAVWPLASGPRAVAALSSSNYVRTAFGPSSGIPETIINRITQSRQGFLWMADGNQHLMRFDGQSFYEAPAPLADSLALAPNGDLWASRASPPLLMHIAAKDLDRFGDLPATTYSLPIESVLQVTSLQFSRSGVFWLTTSRGLYRFDNGQLSVVIPDILIARIKEASNGHLLIVSNKGYREWDGSRLIAHPDVEMELGVKANEIFDVLEDGSGQMWYCTAFGVARKAKGRLQRLGPYGPGHAAYRVYQDARGVIWFAREDGVYRETENGLELIDPEKNARWLFTDRDGQLWIGTNGNGVIRLRDGHVRTFTTAEGLPGNMIMSVVVRADGSVWTGANCGGISRIDGEHIKTYAEKDGLRNSCVFSLAEDMGHDLWIGTYGGGAFRLHDGVFTQFSTAQGVPSDIVTAVFAADDRSVWLGTAAGAARILNGEIQRYSIDGGSPRVLNFYLDRSGGLWAGTAVGPARLNGDRFVVAVTPSPGMVLPIGEDEAGRIYLSRSTEKGLFMLEGNRIVSSEPHFNAQNILRDREGTEWFIGPNLIGPHLVGVAPKTLSEPRLADEPLSYRVVNQDDGLPREACSFSFPCSAVDHQGRLWLATLGGLVAVDLPQMPTTDQKPQLYMKEVRYGRTLQAPGRELVLAPGTTHIDLQFDAIELVAPDKIRLQYRMDGVDKEWMDADPPGMATYNYLPTGTHAFHMRACNRDGVWDPVGVVYRVTQRPYFYQTMAFELSVAGMLGLLLVAGYRLRIRQIANEINARFDERLDERTRLAREIHDTLLQTIQACSLVAEVALEQRGDPSRLENSLAKLSGWLGQAAHESRRVVHALRASTIETKDLAAALRRALEDCQLHRSMETVFSVRGDIREMHPIMRDEVYTIAYEAIRNACTHSKGNRVEVVLRYGNTLSLSIRDNGTGIDPAVVEKGRDGHFGLMGMRERATRIGAEITISSPAGSGATVELVVPGHIVFRAAHRSPLEMARKLFHRTGRKRDWPGEVGGPNRQS